MELASAEESATVFADLVSRICPGTPPVFDVMVLGLGDDGHTASLFPGTDAPTVQDAWATVGRGKGFDRITLTAPVLSAAREVIFLVSGAGKRVSRLSSACLIQLNQPSAPPLAWFNLLGRNDVLILADQDAASDL